MESARVFPAAEPERLPRRCVDALIDAPGLSRQTAANPARQPQFQMMNAPRHDFHSQMECFEERLPDRFARWSCWLRQPKARLIRIPAALLLMLGGIFSVLPVLGLWMLPLGLLLLAVDLPILRPPLTRMLRWIERKWPRPGANPPPAKRTADH